MKFIPLMALLFAFSAHAQLEGLGPIERILFELNFGRNTSKSESPEDYKKNTTKACLEEYANAKRYWLKENKTVEGKVAEAGYFTGMVFTRDQIQNMPNENVHKIKFEIRGTDVLNYETYSTGLRYPHNLPRCKEFFNEEVQVINVGDKLCRRVIFHVPDALSESYAQIYCENSGKLYLSFDPKMEIAPENLVKNSDCVHCRK